MGVLDRVKKSWNAFRSYEESFAKEPYSQGPASYGDYAPQRERPRFYNERSIVSSIYNRIAIDVADIVISHCKVDDNGDYLDKIDSKLNLCLGFEPNVDQAPRDFRQDIVQTLFDHGVAAIVPVDAVKNPENNLEFDTLTMRVGRITSWYPKHVKVSCYNENEGIREEIVLEKRIVAIIPNPFYAVMNEPNSTLQRLVRKLQLLDIVDEASSSGKLDLIIQLPYVIKSEARMKQAEQRRDQIEFQLKGSKYGIAYTDGTEKITQLNRPAENNLLKQIELLKTELYGELGITVDIMNGTANEEAMLNYFNRTIEPILDGIVQAMIRSLLGPVKFGRNERILYFREPFKFVPVGQLADVVDKFSRNEILTPNEIRSAIGYKPSQDPKSNELVNSNMPQPPPQPAGVSFEDMDSMMNEVFDGLASDIDKIGASND